MERKGDKGNGKQTQKRDSAAPIRTDRQNRDSRRTREPFGAGLPRWASGKACPAKATPTTTLWRRTFSAVSNVNWSTCANMTPAVLLKRIFSPISRPFTIRCARIPPLTGSHRALLNCGCVMPLSPDLRDFTYSCDSFRFSALFSVYFFGKGSIPLCSTAITLLANLQRDSNYTCRNYVVVTKKQKKKTTVIAKRMA